jgi:hypothetical protein
MMRAVGWAAMWCLGLVAIGFVSFLFWYGSTVAIGMILPGDIGILELVPAAIVALAPLGWYVWVTIVEPLRLKHAG